MFSKRLEFVKTSVVVTDPEPYPVAHLKVEGVFLQERPDWRRPSQRELRDMLQLGSPYKALDQESQELVEEMGDCIPRNNSEPSQASNSSAPQTQGVSFRKVGRWFAASADGITTGDEAIGQELRRCFAQLSGKTPLEKCS